jgi:hypothetical protein
MAAPQQPALATMIKSQIIAVLPGETFGGAGLGQR